MVALSLRYEKIFLNHYKDYNDIKKLKKLNVDIVNGNGLRFYTKDLCCYSSFLKILSNLDKNLQ